MLDNVDTTELLNTISVPWGIKIIIALAIFYVGYYVGYKVQPMCRVCTQVKLVGRAGFNRGAQLSDQLVKSHSVKTDFLLIY